MPTPAENQDRYPEDWKAISRAIRECAGGRCEFTCHVIRPCRAAINGEAHHLTGSEVVLTVAYLDHQPENCAPENLKAA